MTESVLARGAAVLLLIHVNRGHESANVAVATFIPDNMLPLGGRFKGPTDAAVWFPASVPVGLRIVPRYCFFCTVFAVVVFDASVPAVAGTAAPRSRSASPEIR